MASAMTVQTGGTGSHWLPLSAKSRVCGGRPSLGPEASVDSCPF